jgi:integrase
METRQNINYEKNKKRFKAGFNKIMNSDEISIENKNDFQVYIDDKRAEVISFSRLANVSSFFYLLTTKFMPVKHLLSMKKTDYTRLSIGLMDGDFLSEKNKPYAQNSIQNFQRFIKSYFRCILGETETKNLLGNIKIKDFKPIKKPTLNENEFNKLMDDIPYEEQEIKFIVTFMISVGCRVGELKNMIISDIYEDTDGTLMVNIPASKDSEEREVQIDLFKPYIKYYINDYLTGEKNKTKDDYLIKSTEQHINRKLKLSAIKILGDSFDWITSHSLRRSSATYFAQVLGMTYQQFCYKFGWSPESSVPKRYFNRAELGKTNVSEAMKQDKIHKYASENEEFKRRLEETEKDRVEQKEELNKVSSRLDKYEEILKKDSFHKVSKNINLNYKINGKHVAKTTFQKIMDDSETIMKRVIDNKMCTYEDIEILDEFYKNKVVDNSDKTKLRFKLRDDYMRDTYRLLSKEFKQRILDNNFDNFKTFIFNNLVLFGVTGFKADERIEEEMKLLE